MIYRIDDVNFCTRRRIMEQLHRHFARYGRTMTLGLVMYRLAESEVWDWLQTTPGLEFGLHAMIHKDYSIMHQMDIEQDLGLALQYWEEHRGHLPHLTRFFPPHSRESEALRKACRNLRLELVTYDPGKMAVFHWGEFEEISPLYESNLKDLEKVLAREC